MKERLDTFNELMEWTGVAYRGDIHRLGLWHQTFHCWVVHRTNHGEYAILQLRHSSKDTHPLKFDVSCAGHLEASEAPSDGCRELEEELGVSAKPTSLQRVGVFKNESFSDGIIDREFFNVFVFIRENVALETYRPAVGEVLGVYEIPLVDLWHLRTVDGTQVWVNGIEVDDEGNRQSVRRCIQRTDLVDYPMAYYSMLYQSLANDLSSVVTLQGMDMSRVDSGA